MEGEKMNIVTAEGKYWVDTKYIIIEEGKMVVNVIISQYFNDKLAVVAAKVFDEKLFYPGNSLKICKNVIKEYEKGNNND